MVGNRLSVAGRPSLSAQPPRPLTRRQSGDDLLTGWGPSWWAQTCSIHRLASFCTTMRQVVLRPVYVQSAITIITSRAVRKCYELTRFDLNTETRFRFAPLHVIE